MSELNKVGGGEDARFLAALNDFGATPDRERLARALATYLDVGALAGALVGLEFPTHFRHYLDELAAYGPVLRALLQLVADQGLTFSIAIASDGPALAFSVEDSILAVSVLERPDL